ncbi:hypothetical protein WME88_56150 [Sorangium sp. So ce216]
MSKIMDRPPEEICRKARIPLLLAPSIKAGLDLDWSDPKQKVLAIQTLERLSRKARSVVLMGRIGGPAARR